MAFQLQMLVSETVNHIFANIFKSLPKCQSHMLICYLLSGSVVGGRDSVEGVEVILGAVVQLVLPRPVFCLYLNLYLHLSRDLYFVCI